MERGGKNVNRRIASLESIPMYLNRGVFFFFFSITMWHCCILVELQHVLSKVSLVNVSESISACGSQTTQKY